MRKKDDTKRQFLLNENPNIFCTINSVIANIARQHNKLSNSIDMTFPPTFHYTSFDYYLA